ncbi:MAG TPA: hypothetical protein VGG48_17590 [Rhizomicrobium sp.]|jgi:hypothetical protein
MTYEKQKVACVAEERPELSSILPILMGGNALWHRTSVKSLKAIIDSGFIQPNLGQFEVTYSQSCQCFGRSIGAVCMFDFNSATPEQVLFSADNWGGFLVDRGAATVWIRVDRDKLDPNNIVSSEDASALRPTLIPYVEAWYRGPIPKAAFIAFLVIKRTAIAGHILVPNTASAMDVIEEISIAWEAEQESDEAVRHSNGEFTLAGAVKASASSRER